MDQPGFLQHPLVPHHTWVMLLTVQSPAACALSSPGTCEGSEVWELKPSAPDPQVRSTELGFQLGLSGFQFRLLLPHPPDSRCVNHASPRGSGAVDSDGSAVDSDGSAVCPFLCVGSALDFVVPA
jgi:hypothetical protein